jgi:hypothetical protein
MLVNGRSVPGSYTLVYETTMSPPPVNKLLVNHPVDGDMSGITWVSAEPLMAPREA